MFEIKAIVNGKVVEKLQASSEEEKEEMVTLFQKVYPKGTITSVGY